jgi:hypothetical protein
MGAIDRRKKTWRTTRGETMPIEITANFLQF